MAIARRRRTPPARQMLLDAEIQDARFAAVPELDEWKQRQQEKAAKLWVELLESRQPCQHKGNRCSEVAVIWCAYWRIRGAVNAIENAAFCLKHWPSGEGRALQSSQGWTREGRALADLGWRPNGQWGPMGQEVARVHGRRGDLGSEVG